MYQLTKTRYSPWSVESDIYRATATGGDVTNLTSDTDRHVWVLGWR